MSGYYQVAWLPLCGGLTLLGLAGSWIAWRRRGAAAGLRGAAWSLLPLAAYLIGVIELLWRFGTAISSFAVSFVLSPSVWAGVIVVIVAAVLFAVSGVMRRGRSKRAGERPPDGRSAGGTPPAAGGAGTVALKNGKRKPSQGDDDLGDVADILRRHGIR